MSQNLFHHEQIYRGDLKAFQKRIAICGCGALGSNLADTLARQGFPFVRLIDDDRVERHNISTQVWELSDVGQLKTTALQAHIYRNTEFMYSTAKGRLTSSSVKKLLKDIDLVVDCFDNAESRQILFDYGKENGLSVVHAGLFEDYGEVIWNNRYRVPVATGGIDVCDYPLARNIITITVSVLADEIVRFCLGKQTGNWGLTLNDFGARKL